MSIVPCGRTRSFVAVVLASFVISGCAFLPGFSLFETPTLYYIPVGEVANQVACELQEFIAQHEMEIKRDEDKAAREGTAAVAKEGTAAYAHHKWVLAADEDVKVVLTLQSDEQGYVNFTGINAAQLGFASLQELILSTTSGKTTVPSLAAKMTAKRTKTVAIIFSVSPTALQRDTIKIKAENGADKTITQNCAEWEKTETPAGRLYLRDWLNNYFETINFGTDTKPMERKKPYEDTNLTDTLLHIGRPIAPPEHVPAQFKIQSVELSTTLLLIADVSAGATPTLLGNGSAFIVPINGLSVDYNPDYSHKIDLTINMCDNTPIKTPYDPNPCHKKKYGTAMTPLLVRQCEIYSWLSPLLSGVKPPQDVEVTKKCWSIVMRIGRRHSAHDSRSVVSNC
jgi:hypothetical protein